MPEETGLRPVGGRGRWWQMARDKGLMTPAWGSAAVTDTVTAGDVPTCSKKHHSTREVTREMILWSSYGHLQEVDSAMWVFSSLRKSQNTLLVFYHLCSHFHSTLLVFYHLCTHFYSPVPRVGFAVKQVTALPQSRLLRITLLWKRCLVLAESFYELDSLCLYGKCRSFNHRLNSYLYGFLLFVLFSDIILHRTRVIFFIEFIFKRSSVLIMFATELLLKYAFRRVSILLCVTSDRQHIPRWANS